MTRILLIVLLAANLSGCNLVYSERPLFAVKDARGGALLRPGVWVKPKADCVFDTASPAAKLPECADPMVITASALIPPPKADGAEEKGPKTIPYVLAKGDPRVLQLEVEIEKGKTVWLYQGLVPVRHDEAGRIVEARLWAAMCGPQPPKAPAGSETTRYVTEHPLPGLTVVEHNCLAKAQGPVRGAVQASEAWDDDRGVIRWVRDGTE